MEFVALNGKEIKRVIKHNGRKSMIFSVDMYDRNADIEITGVELLTKNGEDIDIDIDKSLFQIVINNVNIDVISFEENTFNKVTFDNQYGDLFELTGDMKGTILNIEDFQDLNDCDCESSYEDGDDDDTCGCHGNCGACGCGE